MYCHNNPVIYIDPSGHIRNCVKEIYEKLRKENPTMSASETHKLALELTGDKPVNHLIYEAAAKFEMSYGEIVSALDIDDTDNVKVLAAYRQDGYIILM